MKGRKVPALVHRRRRNLKMRVMGNDPARFERLMANIAATSPQNRVYPNFRNGGEGPRPAGSRYLADYGR